MALIEGTNGPDALNGTAFADRIYGYGGNDVLRGFDGNDRLYGGAGNDKLVGGNGINDYYGGSGADWFTMSQRGVGFSDDVIWDFQFDIDQINVVGWGISDFSQIEALLSQDGTGSAFINAYWGGYDHYLIVDDVLPGELVANDFIYSNSGAVTAYGTASADVLFGSRSGDTLNGNAGNDILLGGLGNDRLLGGSGDDDLIGGAGKDEMVGGPGEDYFVFRDQSDTGLGASADVIMAYQQGVDAIDLLDVDANVNAAGNQNFVWVGTGDFTRPGQLGYEISGNRTIVSGNTDSDLAPDFQIVLTGSFNLTPSDFFA